jgi:hypothetical protein
MRRVTYFLLRAALAVSLPSASGASPFVAIRGTAGPGAEPYGSPASPVPWVAGVLPPMLNASAAAEVGYAVAPSVHVAAYAEYSRAYFGSGGDGWLGRSGVMAAYRLVSVDRSQASVWLGIGGGIERAELNVRSRPQNIFGEPDPPAPFMRVERLGFHGTAQAWGEWRVAPWFAIGPCASATFSPFWGFQLGGRVAFGG